MKKILLSLAALAALGQATAQGLTIYSGRSKAFVEPLVKKFEKETGVKVNVRYGKDAQLVAALQEEGSRSPADIFWGNSLGALGTLSAKGQFSKLPSDVYKSVSKDYMPVSKDWLPITIRFRVLAYNKDKLKAKQLPVSVFDLPKMKSLKGRIGWTVSYSSFQDFLAAMIAVHGEAKTKAWLEGMKALQPKDFKTSNVSMLEAIRAGEIDVGLTNHYYIQRVIRLKYPIETHFFKSRDAGNLGNSTGAAILKSSKNQKAAAKFLKSLVSQEAQTFFLSVNFEYPVIGNTIQPTNMLPYEEVSKLGPKVEPSSLPKNIKKAQQLLREAGLL